MAQKSLYEQFTDGLANAVTDIREKVVEEGWFGRVVTGNEHTADPAPEPAAVEPKGLWHEKVQQAREQAEKEPPAPEHGIER